MVVEANKDAARECIIRAKEAMRSNDSEKMHRLLRKAKNLDPNCDVEGVLKNGYIPNDRTTGESTMRPESDENDQNYSHNDHYEDLPNADSSRTFSHRRKKSKDSSANRNHSNASPRRSHSANFEKNGSTIDSDINRIRHCKDYYELLEINKGEFSETILKRKYRELALKFHPDKCKSPGATETFKAIGNAYAVLSDPKKREDYDRYGTTGIGDRRQHGDFYEYDINRGFEADISPEDIFEMFFGGGFSSRSVHRRRTHFRFQRAEENPQETSPILQLLQILPILLLVFGGLLVQFFSSAPPYSLTRDNSYTFMRHTRDLKIPYYVKKDFDANYGKRIQQVEHHVEDDYVSMLRTQCYREKNQRDGLLWTARMRGDSDLWKRAQEMDLSNCRRLEELYH